MNYYERHLGDYAKDAGHLDMLEHGAYSMLMDRYYATEAGIPDADVYRVTRAKSAAEKAAAKRVLTEFFTLTDGVWIKGRIEREIAKFQDKQAKAKRSANARWNPNEPQCEGNANACADGMRTHSEGNAPRARTSHQTPDTSKAKSPDGDSSAAVAADPGIPECPHGDIIAAYHRMLPSLIRVREWTPERQKILRSRWREKPERQTLAWWEDYFAYVGKSDFLMGRTDGRQGPFECDLEWLVRPKNLVKVIEGKYENKAA